MVKVDKSRVHKPGTPKKLTEEQIDEVVTKYNDGMSAAQIARLYDVTPPTIRRYLKQRM